MALSKSNNNVRLLMKSIRFTTRNKCNVFVHLSRFERNLTRKKENKNKHTNKGKNSNKGECDTEK